MLESSTYYVRRQGRVDGPWMVDKLRSEVKLRKLGRHHEVSYDGQVWLRAQEVDGLFPAVALHKTARGAPTTAPELELVLDADGISGTDFQGPQDQWYCSINGEPRGPMSVGDLLVVLTSGQAALDDLVWREGFAEWLSIEMVPELMEKLKSKQATHYAANANPAANFSAAQTSALAVFSLGAGIAIFALCWLPVLGILGLVPIITSSFAIYRIKRSMGTLSGKGLAIAGLALGIVALVIGVLVLMGVAVWFYSA
jgi:thiol:disulfide interchange protein